MRILAQEPYNNICVNLRWPLFVPCSSQQVWHVFFLPFALFRSKQFNKYSNYLPVQWPPTPQERWIVPQRTVKKSCSSWDCQKKAVHHPPSGTKKAGSSHSGQSKNAVLPIHHGDCGQIVKKCCPSSTVHHPPSGIFRLSSTVRRPPGINGTGCQKKKLSTTHPSTVHHQDRQIHHPPLNQW